MSLKFLVRHALSMPPHIALVKSVRYGGRILKSYVRQITERMHSSYQERMHLSYQTGRDDIKGSFFGKKFKVSLPTKRNPSPEITMVTNHRFDLLGSGWVEVRRKHMTRWALSPGNRKRSAAIRALIGPGFDPIDWQIDIKSGYRWREDRLSGTLRYGHEPGVDVKVPWELGRLQHLPWLALEGSLGSAQEFRNLILDFAAANPPGYGVNWLCTMDVAIRAANILMAYDLFISVGAEFDEPFLLEFNALILAHGKHIASHLEWHDIHRANHYLADIAGLLFVAAYLSRSAETDTWLAFSVQQLIKEVGLQFTSDGANFEASTSYHRLSSEMVVYATALVLSLPDDKMAALTEFDNHLWLSHPPLDPAPVELFPVPGSAQISPFPARYFERLERMAEFTIHVTKPNGRIAQIGDNDSGRFFKLCPSFVEVDGKPQEQHLDHRSTVAAINGLFDRSGFAEFAGPDFTFETSIVNALAKGQTVDSYLKGEADPLAVGRVVDKDKDNTNNLTVIAETIIDLPEADILNDLAAISYPDFGLYIWRSPRFFLSVRCGPVGQNGNGGHAHNDQLAIELNIDGEDWIADPGTYLYTPAPDERNAYRSVRAHAAPMLGDKEPSRLDFGLFRLEDNVDARCLWFGPDGFEGSHTAYGAPLHRRIEIQDGQIRITDLTSGRNSSEVIRQIAKDGESLRKLWSIDLPFSPGYGLRD
ncbi:MAG: alginate lyase family protein [Rhodospirillaceae bacterium]|jgi:hypothetical protein|nr:alginate lyase family protein [Rhodospirillaceae bacterium]